MIRFKGYFYYELSLKKMTNDEIMSRIRIGNSPFIQVLGSVDVFKNKKTEENVFVCSSSLAPIAFPYYCFTKGYTNITKRLKIYFIDKESFEYFRELRDVREKLPEDGIYERVLYNGSPIIARIDD